MTPVAEDRRSAAAPDLRRTRQGNAPIRTTIQSIDEMDSQENDQIIAEEAKGGRKTRLAA